MRIFFQGNATSQMEALEELHNNIMFYYYVIIMFAVTQINLVKVILLLCDKVYIYIIKKNPSAGIGSQGKLKICWCKP